MQIKNEIGNIYGRLTVISRGISKNNHANWLCKCSCGNEVIVTGSSLRNNKTKSCGCFKNEETKNRFTKHGLKNHSLYGVYIKMKSRCYNINDKDYKNYGKRGINLCNEWKYSFINFYNWAIKNGYQNNLTIERINVNENYEPNNCTWIENKYQALNRVNSLKFTYHGETKDIRYFSEKYHINYYTLRARLTNYHWNIKDAIEILAKKGNNKHDTTQRLPNPLD